MSSYKSDLINELNDLANAINEKADSSGAKSLPALKTTVQGIQKRKPEQVANIVPDFSFGSYAVYPNNGQVFKSVTIVKPETLIPDNIAEGVTIAGIEGTFAGGGIEVPVTSGWYYGDGNSLGQTLLQLDETPAGLYNIQRYNDSYFGEEIDLPKEGDGPVHFYFEEQPYNLSYGEFPTIGSSVMLTLLGITSNGVYYINDGGSDQTTIEQLEMPTEYNRTVTVQAGEHEYRIEYVI